MKSLFSLLLALFMVGGTGIVAHPAVAQESGPDALIKMVTDDVLTIVRQDKDIQSVNTR